MLCSRMAVPEVGDYVGVRALWNSSLGWDSYGAAVDIVGCKWFRITPSNLRIKNEGYGEESEINRESGKRMMEEDTGR